MNAHEIDGDPDNGCIPCESNERSGNHDMTEGLDPHMNLTTDPKLGGVTGLPTFSEWPLEAP